MKANFSLHIPSKKALILLTATAMTILFSLPRLAVFRHLSDNIHLDLKIYDFLVRGAYAFFIAVVFLLLNLSNKKQSFGIVKLDLNKVSPLLLVNIFTFFLLDLILLHLHLFMFEPYLKEKLFKLFFHISFTLEVVLVVLIAHVYRLLFYNQQIRLSNEHLRKVNAETKYEVLMHQVNPHFLFNSFNTINALINHNKQEAVSFVNNMSDVFRYVLESSKRDIVSVGEELQFTNAYIEMLKGRYGSKLTVLKSVDSKAEKMLLPPMAIQILIENAVKHNVISEKHPFKIEISLTNNYELKISNPVRKKKVPVDTLGIGLSNLNQRCLYLSGREIIIQKTDNEFSVRVPLIKPDEHTNY